VSGRPDGPGEADWAAAVRAIRATPHDAAVLMVCHVNPDADALGSMLAVGQALRDAGYRAISASFGEPFELPDTYDWLPGLDLLVAPAETPQHPALAMSFDAASLGRLGEFAPRITAGTSIMLDHHASNPGFGTVRLLRPGAAATAVIAAELIDRLGVALRPPIAACLYGALAADTGSFKFDSATAEVHRLAARLIATGISPGDIARRLFDSRPFGAVRLTGDVLGRAVLEPAGAGGLGLVWTYATLDDLTRHGQRPAVLESLIDAIRSAQEADVACVIKEVAPREWAVSLRSRGGVDVAKVAVALGGGGHRLAAGFTGYGALDAVIATVRAGLAVAG
jgi:bifunctional oligoribonuclease and PAP phosphatase NrnA